MTDEPRTLDKLPPTLQHALDLSRELGLLSSAIHAERSYLDQLAQLAQEVGRPGIPASLALRMANASARVDELVASHAAISAELAGHSRLGYSPTVPVRVYTHS